MKVIVKSAINFMLECSNDIKTMFGGKSMLSPKKSERLGSGSLN